MKRIVPLLLSLMLLLGCVANAAPVRSIVGETVSSVTLPPEPGDVSAPDEEETDDDHLPDVQEDDPLYPIPEPLADYRYYDQDDWEELTSAVMFDADLDQDGVAEPVSFALDTEEDATTIAWGDSAVLLEESALFVEAAVLDLDPQSPFYNLLVVVDYGSDSYITIELHPETGQLVKGSMVSGDWTWEDGALIFYEQTDFLGTAFGQRTYHGDDLVPDSPWLTMCSIPTPEELADEEEREWLIDGGTLLHTIRPVPCTVDGENSVIPADTYVYRLRFHSDFVLAEVVLLDGTVARIEGSVGEDGWPYLIEGRDMLEYFDNLFFAD